MGKKVNWKRRTRSSSRTPVSARERNGRRQRSDLHSGPTWNLIRHREMLVGADHALSPKSGYPLGVLCLSGDITPQQHDAGCKFRALDARYHFSRGLPRRHPKTITGEAFSASAGNTDNAIDPQQWEKLRIQYRDLLRTVLEKASLRAHWAVIDIVLFDQWPSPYVMDELRAGLNVLVDYFQVPISGEKSS